ncbi:hypothetical protein Ancab_006805 [Ancistrocladus abbreviatus]
MKALRVIATIAVVKKALHKSALVHLQNANFQWLIFKPLVEELPGFGAVCYSLRHKKKLDLTLKVVGGDISSIPGLHDAIEKRLYMVLQMEVIDAQNRGYSEPFSLEWIRITLEVLMTANATLAFPMSVYTVLNLYDLLIKYIVMVRDFAQGTIRDAIEDSITWPVSKIIPILPGDYSDLELNPVGTLVVKLVQAKKLTNKDLIGKSDPFAVIYVGPVRDRMKTSKVINNDLNPIWNECFEFIVEDKSTQHLVVKIFDDEGLQAAELIGCAKFQLNRLEPGKFKDVWLKLVKDLEVQRDNKNRGQVHLELLYIPFARENHYTNPFASNFPMTSLERVLKNGVDGLEATESGIVHAPKQKDVIVRGVLSVTVISADDLPPTDLMGKADPYVVLKMKKSETWNKTRVVNESLNPVWNQTFDLLIEDGLHDMLTLEVWDHDTFGRITWGAAF